MEFIATLAELCERIPVLWQSTTKNFGSNTGIMLNILNTASSAVFAAIKPFYGEDLKLNTPRLTSPIKLSMNEDFQDSWGVDLKYVNPGGDFSTIETQTEHIIITATSETDFSVEGYFSGNLGSGSKSQSFISTNNMIAIPSSAWTSGNFVVGDKYIFSRNWYEPLLTQLASYWAANQVLAGRYVSEGINDLDFENAEFLKQFNSLKKALIDPDTPETLEAPNAIFVQPGFVEDQDWMKGYNINKYGLDEEYNG